MIKRILLGLGSPHYTQSAIRHAVELARRFEASITGASVVDIQRLQSVGPVPLGADYWAEELRQHRVRMAREHIQQAIDEFTDTCHKEGVAHFVRRESGEPFAELISQARYHDLMVFGLKSLFEHDVVEDPHNVLIRLVASGVRPLIAVAPEYRPAQRMLIAYSGSMESAKTMKRFVQLRPFGDPKIRIITFATKRDEGAELVDNAAEYCRAHGFDAEVDVIEGSPKYRLIPYANEWNADMIVLGNSAKNLLLRRVLGETALYAMENADRPLFLCQ